MYVLYAMHVMYVIYVMYVMYVGRYVRIYVCMYLSMICHLYYLCYLYQVVPSTCRGGSFEKEKWLIGTHGGLKRRQLE